MRFEEWVKKQNDEFFAIAKGSDRYLIYRYAKGIANDTETNVIAGAISDCSYRISVYRKGKKTIMQIINMKKEKRGIAICHENDEFDPEIGIAYAWARYKKEAIPSFSVKKELSEMQNGDTFYFQNSKYQFIGYYKLNIYICSCGNNITQFRDYGYKYEVIS